MAFPGWAVGWNGVLGGGLFLSFIGSRDVAVHRRVLVELLAVETDNAIATGFLGHVERVVRCSDQRLTVPDSGMGPGRDAEARRAPEGAALERERVSLHLLTHT